MLIAIITGVLLYIASKSSVILIMAVCTFLISIWLMLKYQKLISKSLIINGLILGLLCSIAMYQYFPTSISIFIAVPCFFISGSILNSRFQITIININNYSYVKIIKSFLIGCFFALPMAISNCSDAISSNGYKWITHFWQPILAFNMVVLEETWVRLFIITFIFALVSSKTNKKFIPILASILISSTIFGFTHYPNIDIQNCFNIVILYGLPLGVLFYKRDFETVIGYHFMINIIGAISAYFLNSNLL